MHTNATVTITRRGNAFNDNGYIEEDPGDAPVLSNVPCMFGQQRGARRVFSDGIRESVKAVYGLFIPDEPTAGITIGDQAEVTHGGITRTYTVNDAVYTEGITEAHWELTIEALKTP